MAFDAFLKIDGVPGESTDEKHKDWIEILSFSFGASQPASVSSATGGRTAERVNIQDFSSVKVIDKASPMLFLHCCDGKHVPKVEVEVCEAGGNKHIYLKYTFENVIVSSVRPGGTAQGGEAKPVEEVAFNFGRVKMEYTPLSHTGQPLGKVASGWDLEANKKL